MVNSNIAMGAQPVQINDPMNQLAKMMQIKQAMQQNDINDAAMQDRQRGYEDTNKLNSLYASSMGENGTIDRNKLYQTVAQNNMGSKIPGLQKGFLDTDEAQGKVNKQKSEALDSRIKQSRELLTGVKTLPDYLAWHEGNHADPVMAEFFASKGITAAQSRARIMEASQRPGGLQELIAQSSLGMEKFMDKNTRTADNIATVGASIENSKRTAQTAREGHAIQRENNRLAPGKASDKMTEDQGKATGWLVQAENAFKNMMAVGVDKDGNPTSAAKPGFNDGLAAIPSFGFTGAIANSFRGADRQKFMQSASSLSEALLRAATGAGVNKDEALQKVQELTPVFGEDSKTTKQKYAAIPLYIESLKVRAGPGAKKAETVLKPPASGGSDIHSLADAILKGGD